jgi:transposase InsO family protein
MSAAISPSTQRPYGVQRVCRVWVVPRSTFHRAKQPAEPGSVRPRGPKPRLDDAGLLAAIQADLAASPFTGEGHRKVWARLRYGLGLPVGRNRVLRLMRQHQLLSPFRRPPRPANDHDGTLLTDAPDRLWGTDATLVPTAEDGRIWVFAAIDHGNAEVVGHFVSTDGSRFSALEPIAQAVAARFGSFGADSARGVTVRADHGPQYVSRHFTRQLAHGGAGLSHSYPYQPQTTDVIDKGLLCLPLLAGMTATLGRPAFASLVGALRRAGRGRSDRPPFSARSMLSSPRARVTARRRAGPEVEALPCSLHGRSSLPAPKRALGPRAFQPCTSRS